MVGQRSANGDDRILSGIGDLRSQLLILRPVMCELDDIQNTYPKGLPFLRTRSPFLCRLLNGRPATDAVQLIEWNSQTPSKPDRPQSAFPNQLPNGTGAYLKVSGSLGDCHRPSSPGWKSENSFHRECLIVELPYGDGHAEGAPGGAVDSNLHVGSTGQPSLLLAPGTTAGRTRF